MNVIHKPTPPADMVQALHGHVGTGAMDADDESLIASLSQQMHVEQVRALSDNEIDTLTRLHRKLI